MSKLHSLSQAYLDMKKERLALQRKVDKMEAQEKELGAEIIEMFRRPDGSFDPESISEVEGLAITVRSKPEPVAVDWAALLEWIKSTGSVDLLQKRLTPNAVKARWEAKETVPGIDAVEKQTLYIEEL